MGMGMDKGMGMGMGLNARCLIIEGRNEGMI